MPIGFAFCHGWGCDSKIWDEWKMILKNYPCVFLECGYFSNQDFNILLNANRQWIAVGHSLGFSKLLASGFPFQAYVCIQGFLKFLEDGNKLHHRALNQMTKNFKLDPQKTLEAFYQNAQIPLKYQPLVEKLQFEKLLADLEWLGVLDQRQLFEKIKCPTCVLTTTGDAIISVQSVLNDFNMHPWVQSYTYPADNHALPATQPQWCMAQIKRFFESLGDGVSDHLLWAQD